VFELSEMEEIVQEFLVESHENLDQLDRDLVELERDPGSRELLAGIFRTIHTIKGTSGFLAFGTLEQVSHVGEGLLSRLRDGELELDFERAAALLDLVDAIRTVLASIEATGAEGQHDFSALVAQLERLQSADPDAPRLVQPRPAADPAPEPADHDGGETEVDSRRGVADHSIRVDIGVLDELMQMVGELVLTRNRIVQQAGTIADPALMHTAHRLDVIAAGLQEGVMKTRMQPIGNIWSRMPRVVRDLGVVCGRQVRVEMEGRETELDRSLLEAIKDPLTHLVRNAVDHGVEPPQERVALGKPAEGVIGLRAYQQGGKVHIEIADDGRGIDPERVGLKAVERGLLTPEQLANLSPEETTSLVFQPGFSTAEAVSSVSGRGVGMDVVRTNIEQVGGTFALRSVPGFGSTVTLQIPLTLAIIPALTVATGGQRLAIPQLSLVELVAVPAGEVRTTIEDVSGVPVLRLRGRLLPLVHLDAALGLTSCRRADGTVSVVVVQSEGRQFGIVVDRVVDTEEIVVKPLSSQLAGIGLYAGAMVSGDGAVALILDVTALGHRSGVLGAARDLAGTAEPEQVTVEQEREAFLIVGVGPDRRVAVPLAAVHRIEELSTATLEQVGGREVIQYRDGILPLARLARVMGVAEDPGPQERVQVVVYSEGGRSVGLVVSAIHDISDDFDGVSSDLGGPGLNGSVVVGRQVAELLDVRGAVLAADPLFYEPAAPATLDWMAVPS